MSDDQSKGKGQVPPSRRSRLGTIDGYILVEKLGEGGMGTVFRAFHPKERKLVALKISRRLSKDSAEAVKKKEKRFRREIEVMQSLDHPHIIHIQDFGWDEEGQRIYLAMDYIKGTDLHQLLKKEGSLALSRALKIFDKICQAVFYFHEENILHRDLKPANILLDEEETPLVTDFGFAKILDSNTSTITEPDRIIGSLTYMSPEQLEGNLLGEVSFATDVYSLGVILFIMITGERPFQGPPMDVVLKKFEENVPRLCEFLPKIPREIDDFCASMMALYPDKRPSMKMVCQKISRWVEEGTFF